MTNTTTTPAGTGRAVGHYVVIWDGGQVIDSYLNPATHEREPVSIVKARQEFRGVAGVRVERVDGTVVIDNAGSDSFPWYRGVRRSYR